MAGNIVSAVMFSNCFTSFTFLMRKLICILALACIDTVTAYNTFTIDTGRANFKVLNFGTLEIFEITNKNSYRRILSLTVFPSV